ncbi:hypothetical protein HMPREF1548_00858 [Clostridium sp. KLE 1755]|nr:hypothetical protein HMPREF1548_00858 [Clostridium sp. KLE 1755]
MPTAAGKKKDGWIYTPTAFCSFVCFVLSNVTVQNIQYIRHPEQLLFN